MTTSKAYVHFFNRNHLGMIVSDVYISIDELASNGIPFDENDEEYEESDDVLYLEDNQGNFFPIKEFITKGLEHFLQM